MYTLKCVHFVLSKCVILFLLSIKRHNSILRKHNANAFNLWFTNGKRTHWFILLEMKGDICMSEIHNSDIRELLDAIPVIPNELMAEYLTRQYQVSKNMAQEIIYNACRKGSNRRPACYPTKEGLAKADYITMTSSIRKRCRAFRVACEFLPESRNFTIPSGTPWLLSFCFDGSVYYVCEFERGNELILGDTIRSLGIREDMMSVTSRIAILAPGANRKLLSECGIRYFCMVSDNYDLNVTEQIDDEDVWNGVPIIK